MSDALSSAIRTLAAIEADPPKLTWPYELRRTVRVMDCGVVRLQCVTADRLQFVGWEARGLDGRSVAHGRCATKEGALVEARDALLALDPPEQETTE